MTTESTRPPRRAPRAHTRAHERQIRRHLRVVSSFETPQVPSGMTAVALGVDLSAPPRRIAARRMVLEHPMAWAVFPPGKWTLVDGEIDIVPAGALPVGVDAWFAHRT